MPKTKILTNKIDGFEKDGKPFFPSFPRRRESSVSKDLRNAWTPFFNGVTTSYEAVKIGWKTTTQNA
jgi:hypothetical protein